MREILLAVSTYYGVKPADLTSTAKFRLVAHPRQMALYLSRTLAGQTYPQIGQFYHRDHSTVHYAVQIVAERIKADRKAWAAHHRIKRRLKDAVARRHAIYSQELAA